MQQQTDIFDYLEERLTVRVSIAIGIGEFDRQIRTFSTVAEKNKYLSELNIFSRKKSRDGISEHIVVRGEYE